MSNKNQDKYKMLYYILYLEAGQSLFRGQFWQLGFWALQIARLPAE